MANEWIDISMVTPNEFEERMKLFDVELTDPILTGELIVGDEKYLEEKRAQLTVQPITSEAISHNIMQSMGQREIEPRLDDFLKPVSRKYQKTFLRNALALKQGKRSLTKSILMDEHLNELKGSTKKKYVRTTINV